jgi:hypothetical protein
MAKIKGWDRLNEQQYYNGKSGDIVFLEYSNGWHIVSGGRIPKMRFDQKKSAKNYAMQYMRSHPHG